MATLVACTGWLDPTHLRGDYRESFDSAEPSLQLADADCSAEVLYQDRVFQHVHGGAGCERLVLRAGRGTRIYLAQDVAPAQIIEELKIHAWVKGDRPGFQLLARVVLPRTLDRRTGLPVTTFVWGGSYRDVGGWQLLTLAHLPKLLERQVRVLNSERKEAVDARQAYVDKIVVNAYAGPGITQFWIDDLEIEGHASIGEAGESRRPTAAPIAEPTPGESRPRRPEPAAVAPAQASRPEAAPHLQGSILIVRGRPFLPCAVIDRGESLSWLRSLGFNTVFLSQAPHAEQIAVANDLDMWFVPPIGRAARSGDDAGDRTLALLVPAESRSTTTGGTLRLVGIPKQGGDLRAEAAKGELAMIREPRWPASELAERMAGGRPAAEEVSSNSRPVWALIDTEQVVHDALADAPDDGIVRRERLRRALRSAALKCVAAGARGLCFSNSLPESLRDADVPNWTVVLELVLGELELLAPWISGGTPPEALASPHRDWGAFALESNRSRLVLLISDAPAGPAAPGERRGSRRAPTWGETAVRHRSATVPAGDVLQVVDSGAPTAAEAYVLEDGRLKTLPRQRVAGGVGLRITPTDSACVAVLTHDPLVVGYLARRGAARRDSRAPLRDTVKN